jgi:pyruvate kinase
MDLTWTTPPAGAEPPAGGAGETTRSLFTLGASTVRPEAIRRWSRRGIALFGIDLAHVSLAALEDLVALVQAHSAVPLALVTMGPQVRTGLVVGDVHLAAGDIVSLTSEKILGTNRRLSFRPAGLFLSLRPGSRLAVDGGPLLRVGRIEGGAATAVVVEGGEVGTNRPVSVDPAPRLPCLTEKDRRAVEIGRRLGITRYALSFAASAPDVDQLRGLVPGAEVIARIENRAGVWNRDEIIQAADAVVVDGAALLREIPVDQVSFYQDAIARQAARWHTPVYRPANLREDDRPLVAV